MAGSEMNLRRLRLSANMTQQQLADAIGVDRAAVSQWESGTAYPRMGKAMKLCDLFGVSLDQLVGYREDVSAAAGEIGWSIRSFREERGMTQRQLGEIAGVSGMAVSQWENGRAVPRMGAIQRMSDYFRVPKSRIMGDSVEYFAVDLSEPPDALSPDERELLALYRSMDADGREMALCAVRGMASSRADAGHVAEGIA